VEKTFGPEGGPAQATTYNYNLKIGLSAGGVGPVGLPVR